MNTAGILAAFPNLSALVVGDICLDRWCSYDPGASEPSRETGIPRLGVVATQVSPGAGGTVAGNLRSLGAGRVGVLGAIGEDGHGWELRGALAGLGIESGLLIPVAGMQTFTYTKLLRGPDGVEDQPRVDFINARPRSPEAEARILDELRRAAARFDVILVADQAETDEGGVVTPAVRELLAELARGQAGAKVFWADSRRRAELFRDVIVKPNREEAESASRRLLGTVDYAALRRALRAPALIVTHGDQGAVVVEPDGETWVRARPVAHPVDICGAGDSFSAGAAMTLAVTGSAVEAARVGNLAAGVTIGKKGTGTAGPQEILAAEAAP